MSGYKVETRGCRRTEFVGLLKVKTMN